MILNPEVVGTNGNIFSENLFSYTGLVYDKSTGLYYAKARFYDAKIGRFISEDSYRGEQEEVLSRNLYIYGYNNPNRYKDLSGYNVMDFAQGLTDTLDNNIFFGLVKRILKRVIGKGDYHYKNELHYYAGRLTGDVISLLHGMKQIISAVTKIVGSISAGGALTLASAGGLTIGGISIAVEGVIAGSIQVSYGGTVISAAASNFSNDVAKFSELSKKSYGTKPNQVHHIATNKSKKYVQQFNNIVNKYGLDLDDAWNKELMPHQGRHPYAYHDYVLDNMQKFDKIANGDKSKFLKLFDQMKQKIINNPGMLTKDYWN